MSSWPETLEIIQAGSLFALLFSCAVTDLQGRKAGNVLIASFFLIGIVVQGLRGGLPGTGHALFGAVTAFAPCVALWWLGGIGAADAKEMTAIGALTSWRFVMWGSFYTALCGAVLAIVVLSWKKSWREMLRGAWKMGRKDRRSELQKTDSRTTVPYALAITAGCLWGVFSYWSRYGITPW